MSHYRKITVNGKEYEYVIGRSIIKIKGLTVIERDLDNHSVITPGMIAEYIKTGKFNTTAKKCETCNTGKMVEHMSCNPFALEIRGKQIWGYFCDSCLGQMADAI